MASRDDISSWLSAQDSSRALIPSQGGGALQPRLEWAGLVSDHSHINAVGPIGAGVDDVQSLSTNLMLTLLASVACHQVSLTFHRPCLEALLWAQTSTALHFAPMTSQPPPVPVVLGTGCSFSSPKLLTVAISDVQLAPISQPPRFC